LEGVPVRDTFWRQNVKGKRKSSRARFDKWARKKSNWAYRELQAYLKYVSEQNIDPLSVKGSFAGALGFAQFVPSSVLMYGVDGNKDGRVNLYEHHDAINSVANYLKRHGWKPELGPKKATKVLLKYNNSTPYAETILKVARRLGRDGSI